LSEACIKENKDALSAKSKGMCTQTVQTALTGAQINEMEVERLALKFGAPETAQKFKEAFDNAKELNSSIPEFAAMSAGEGSAQVDSKPAASAGQKEAPKAPCRGKALGYEQIVHGRSTHGSSPANLRGEKKSEELMGAATATTPIQ